MASNKGSYSPLPPTQQQSSSVTVVQAGGASPSFYHQSTTSTSASGQKPTVVQRTVVGQPAVQPQVRPVIVQQPAYQPTQAESMLGGLGRAFDTAVKDVTYASKDISYTVYNPLERLKPGFRVQLVSKVCGKSLRTLEGGKVDCMGTAGTASQYDVLTSGLQNYSIKLRNVAQPHCYLAVVKDFLVGHGQGGTDCDFTPTLVTDNHVTLESVLAPGSHVGALPSGQITAPSQTGKGTDASHFTVKYVGPSKPTA